MGKYTCRECVTDGGFHYDDNGVPSRCPNYGITKNHEAALALTKQQNTKAFEAAKQIIRDFAETHMEFSSNHTQEAMDQAQVPGPTIGRAFTACAEERVIENTGRMVKHRDNTIRHRVSLWKSLKHPAYLAANFSPASSAGLLTGQAR